LFVLTLLLLYGGRHAEAVIAANSFEQTVARVFLMIKRIIEARPLLRREAKITEGKITIAGATITAIPSDAASDGILMAWHHEPVAYAGYEGESVLLEELYKRGLNQQQVGPALYAGAWCGACRPATFHPAMVPAARAPAPPGLPVPFATDPDRQ
jgi:hypothetical protein